MRIEEVIAKALDKTLNDRYVLANMVFTRVRQLENGAQPLVDVEVKDYKLSDIAMMEIAGGKIRVEKIS